MSNGGKLTKEIHVFKKVINFDQNSVKQEHQTRNPQHPSFTLDRNGYWQNESYPSNQRQIIE